MEHKNYSELDLFSRGKYEPENNFRPSSARLSSIRKHDKALLTIIGFIIAVTVAYMIGVNQGKQSVSGNRTVQFHTVLQNNQQSAPVPVTRTSRSVITREPSQESRTVKIKESLPSASNTDYYTIQVASYRKKEHASSTMEILRKTGQPVHLVSGGGYIALCVGNFTDKETAKSFLPKLKKNYKDCFIRRL